MTQSFHYCLSKLCSGDPFIWSHCPFSAHANAQWKIPHFLGLGNSSVGKEFAAHGMRTWLWFPEPTESSVCLQSNGLFWIGGRRRRTPGSPWASKAGMQRSKQDICLNKVEGEDWYLRLLSSDLHTGCSGDGAHVFCCCCCCYYGTGSSF